MRREARHRIAVTHLTLFAALLLASCTPLVPALDDQALQNAVELKGTTLGLLDQHISGKTYSEMEDRIVQLVIDLRQAQTYVQAIPRNQTSAGQWQIVNKIVIDFWLAQWRKYDPADASSSGGPVFAALQSRNIATAFDAIICLEVNKDYSQPLKTCSDAVEQAKGILSSVEGASP